jgi:5'-3' exonuclease
MGIPSYFSHIVKSHRRIIKQYKKNMNIHNLYLDCNSIIYDVVNKIDILVINNNEYEEAILKQTSISISNYIKSINPINKVIIAFDGVAPIAKLEQQRNRRYKSWFQNEIIKRINNDNKDKWDTTCITPGTEFMNKLNKYINNYFNNNKFNVNEIIISGSDIPGEGEHKIFNYIRENKDYHKDTTTVIYGLDADLIMLTLNHLYISKQLYLFRETPHFIKTIDKTLNPHELYLIDIPNLEDEIINHFIYFGNTANKDEKILLTDEQKNRKILDYILICFMLGNDFLPHFPSINIRTNGINILMNAYIEVFKNHNDSLTDGKKIIWKHFRKYISYLSNYELDYFKDEMKIRDKWEKKNTYSGTSNSNQFEELFMLIPTKNRELEKYINPGDKGWETRYYKTLFKIDIDEDRKTQICTNYLHGLEWTLKYYTEGCPDWRWCYNYHYPPLLKDLLLYIPYFDTEFICNKNTKPVHEYTQLCYVLPRNSLHYLPKKIYLSLKKKHSDLYGLDYKFNWSYCKYFWEAHVELPHINIENIEDIVYEDIVVDKQ